MECDVCAQRGWDRCTCADWPRFGSGVDACWAASPIVLKRHDLSAWDHWMSDRSDGVPSFTSCGRAGLGRIGLCEEHQREILGKVVS